MATKSKTIYCYDIKATKYRGGSLRASACYLTKRAGFTAMKKTKKRLMEKYDKVTIEGPLMNQLYDE